MRHVFFITLYAAFFCICSSSQVVAEGQKWPPSCRTVARRAQAVCNKYCETLRCTSHPKGRACRKTFSVFHKLSHKTQVPCAPRTKCSGANRKICNKYCNELRCYEAPAARVCSKLRTQYQRRSRVTYLPCDDQCPRDPSKILPGVCGCGVPDVDSDHDGSPGCRDACPQDPGKVAPGRCGCGVPDSDPSCGGTVKKGIGGPVLLTADGIGDIWFLECGSIGSQSEVKENVVFVDGAQKIEKTPGRLSWLEISCRQGLSLSGEIDAWRGKVEKGDLAGARTSAALKFYNSSAQEIAGWDLSNAWPTALSARTLDVNLVWGDIKISFVNELILAHEGLVRSK